MNRQLFINEFALNIVPLLAFVCICHATHYQNFMHSKAKQQTRRKKSLTVTPGISKLFPLNDFRIFHRIVTLRIWCPIKLYYEIVRFFLLITFALQCVKNNERNSSLVTRSERVY